MQCRDGGWAAFDVDNTRALCRELPFCDFGELIDPPSADVTAHVVEMLSVPTRTSPAARARRRMAAAPSKSPTARGSGAGAPTTSTGPAPSFPALVAAGLEAGDTRRSAGPSRWLEAHQNLDGGWGEDLRSYPTTPWRGRGTSTASQTGVGAAGTARRGRAHRCGPARACDFLVETQRADGTWDEPWFTGTGFPGDFYINYHLYRLVFPSHGAGPVRERLGCRRPARG